MFNFPPRVMRKRDVCQSIEEGIESTNRHIIATAAVPRPINRVGKDEARPRARGSLSQGTAW